MVEPVADQMAELGIHPDRVRELFGPTLTDRTVARLLGSRRLRRRLGGTLAAPSALAPEEAAIAAHPPTAILRAGALLHTQALRAVLSGPEVKALVTAIGRDAHAFALRHGVEAEGRHNGGDLAAAIHHDGQLCLGAWLADRSPELRRCVLLQVPAGSPVETGPFPADIAAAAESVMAIVAGDLAGDPAHG